MQIIKAASEIHNFSLKCRSNFLKIGFVPTMGALHKGHLSLIAAAKSENDQTVCSIFVNPSQFNEAADFEKYPRQLDTDLKLLEEAGVDVAFIPDVTEVYPHPDRKNYDLGKVAAIIEGAHRPGHFNGVASVVKRFFEIIRPHRAYFGLKDYQQYLIIRNLVKNYALDIEIVGCPILRENSGLAMSSRNQLLSADGRQVASQLSETLVKTKSAAADHGAAELEKRGLDLLKAKEGVDVEYFLIVDADTLKTNPDSKSNRIALLAARVEGVRLIDNMFLDK